MKYKSDNSSAPAVLNRAIELGTDRMSLSPKDDPRTWLVPGPREVPRPPLQARLLYYELTKSQRALLRAMLE